ncbi:hypothetical protein DS909_02340 [Phaeobacter gallaeciensis]|uniref:Uncharacterized protein n=2 Tax=Roseobacteraceae TaxID=2854170 RepID=A0A366X8J5_9RHOB|nr:MULTISPECIES: hypothetical protein [Roseobacteraceae]MBT3142672.1 hypothetical protein [Falsiruegeria litorea]MBT8168196.1 hypothetical protein [Falsiruegeria litorea]RBW61571.1 hypothetical protein DS909_02340 [Phaeobacter gallaeciensis]
MVEEQLQFDRRIQRLSRKHQSMSRGYSTRMRADGLIVTTPQRNGLKVPLRAILFVFVALFAFKGFLLASIGPESYADRVQRLSEGTVVEQAGAWVMQIEPVSAFIASQIGPILR